MSSSPRRKSNENDLGEDGIPDFVDGFSATGAPPAGDVLATDEPRAFGIPMRLLIKNLHDGVQYRDVKYTFAYTASDPADASVTEINEDGEVVGYEGHAPPGFRVWLDRLPRRDKRSVKDGGHFIPAGTSFEAEEINMEDGVEIFYVEATPGAEEFTGDDLFITVTASFDSDKQGDIVWVDKVKIRPIVMQFVTKDEGGGIVPTDFVGVCTPRPEIKLADPQVRVAGNNVRVTIRCEEILDPVADNLPRGVADIADVAITVNGSEQGTAAVSAVAGGAASFWRQHPYRGTFNPVNLSLPLEEGTHTVRVTTGENAAGLTGFAEFAFTLVKETIGGGGGSMAVNIHLPVEPTPQVADQLQYYFGVRDPLEDDPWFAELPNQTASLVFHGEFDGLSAQVRILGRSPRLTPQIDSFNARFPVVVLDEIREMTGQFTETGPATNIFRHTLTIPAPPPRERWRVSFVSQCTGNLSDYTPFAMRVKGLPEPEGYAGALDQHNADLTESSLAPTDGWYYMLGGSDLIAVPICRNDNVLVVYHDKDTGEIVEVEPMGDLKLPGEIKTKDALDQWVAKKLLNIIHIKTVEVEESSLGPVIVVKGANVNMKTTIRPPNFTVPPKEPKWLFQKLKADGSWEEWDSFGPNAFGTQYAHTTTMGGIYRVKCVLSIGRTCRVEKVFERTEDDPHSDMKAGEPDAFGVVDKQSQLLMWAHARPHLGSTYYAKDGGLPLWRDPERKFTDKNKCNVFVADVCDEAGFNVGMPIKRVYSKAPPSANNWAGMPDENDPNAPYPIPGWLLLYENEYPQPGFVAASGYETGGSGHCGIIDYDGRWIAAGPDAVNRKSDSHMWRRYYLDKTTKPVGQRNVATMEDAP